MIYPDDGMTAQACRRVDELKQINRDGQTERRRLRAIMNGGAGALSALLGDKVQGDSLPVANLMVSADARLAQKLGRAPDIKTDPPASNDSERARKGAEKRARIVESFDHGGRMKMILPQVGRWLPGYGFVPFVVRQGTLEDGSPYPMVEVRDPYYAYPGPWGVGQQPKDIAFCYTISKEDLCARYPQHATKIKQAGESRGAVDLASWSSQNGGGVEIAEYFSKQGTWWLLPSANLLLEYTPNALTRPHFHVAKRFAFDRLVGQYDHVIGLMAAMARLNLLLIIATEDAVLSEINIIGSLDGDKYKRGRNVVNYLTPGSTIDKSNSRVPFEAFQYMNVLEKQLRVVAGYSGMDDGTSPSSWTTGQGLQELKSEVGLEVREYFTVIEDALVTVDSLRLEWAERFYAGQDLPMAGVRGGTPFEETYDPGKDIKGNWRTRRVYGAMAGFDDPQKLQFGLLLKQAGAMDTLTLMENIDGLENHSRILERVDTERAKTVVYDYLLAAAGQGEPKALAAAIEMLPAGDMKTMLSTIFAPEPEPQPDPLAALAGGGGGVPDVATIMSKITAGASGTGSQVSAQTISPTAA